MVRSSQAPRSKTHRLPAVVAVLVAGSMVQQLSAQGLHSARLATRFHSRTAPGLRFSTASARSTGTLHVALPEPPASGVAPLSARPVDPIEIDSALATAPWAPGLSPSEFGHFSEPAAGIGFRHAGTFPFGSEQPDGLDAPAPAGICAAVQSLKCLSPLPLILARGLGGRANVRPSTIFSLATLSRMLQGDLYLPFRQSAGGLRFDYDDNVRPGPKTSALSRGYASAMFTSPLKRNRMTFSAGALFGVRSAAFSTGGLRSMASAAEKKAVPSLGMRLSF